MSRHLSTWWLCRQFFVSNPLFLDLGNRHSLGIFWATDVQTFPNYRNVFSKKKLDIDLKKIDRYDDDDDDDNDDDEDDDDDE